MGSSQGIICVASLLFLLPLIMGSCCQRESDAPPKPPQKSLSKKHPEVTTPTTPLMTSYDNITCQSPAVKSQGSSRRGSKPKLERRFSSSKLLLKKEAEKTTGLTIKKLTGSIDALYEIIDTLGSDWVLLAENRITKKKNVVKKVPKSTRVKTTAQGKSPLESFKEEVQLLSQIDHPNVIRLYELLEDRDFIYVISEALLGGELLDFVTHSQSINEQFVAKIGFQVLHALSYCHTKGIVHKGLHPDCLILQGVPKDSDIHVKITGFGTVNLLTKQEALQRKVGAVFFMSPEALDGNYIDKSDVWSCGTILYLLLSGNPPFKGSTSDEIIEKIRSQEMRFPMSSWANISPEVICLLRAMVSKDVASRPSAAECLSNPWIEQSRKEMAVSDKSFISTLQHIKTFRSTQILRQTVLSFIAAQINASPELHRVDDIFRTMDRNNDGKLSREEFLEAYAAHMPRDQAIMIVERVMKMLDLDGDGLVDYSEFLLAARNHSLLLTQKNLKFVFSVFDRDQRGMIKMDELKESLRTKDRDMSDELWDTLLRKVDSNNDGMLSFSKFSQLMLLAVEG